MRENKSLAILLKKKSLPNDDAILDFLTMEFGKITVFSKKFLKSKKRNEIDFFRVIEIEFFQGRNSKSLKKANTISLFHNFSRDFKSTQVGFSWLEILTKILPEEEISHDLFKQIINIFSNFESDYSSLWNAFFQIQMLDKAGFWPKFDLIRDDIYFYPALKKISRENLPDSIFISNLDRQVLEFLRRSSLDDFINKKEALPKDLSKITEVLSAIEEFK